MLNSAKLRNEAYIDHLIIDCNNFDPDSENVLLTNKILRKLFAEYLSNIDDTLTLEEKENKILQLLDTVYFKSLSLDEKFKLLNDYTESTFPPIYYLGLHKADNVLWYLFKKELVNLSGIAIETLYIRKNQGPTSIASTYNLNDIAPSEDSSSKEPQDDPKGKSKIKVDEREEELSELEIAKTINNEKELLAQNFEENFDLSLALYLDRVKLSKSELIQKLIEHNNLITSLFGITLNEIVTHLIKYDLNDLTSINSLIDYINTLPLEQQHILFLAKQLDDSLKLALNEDPLKKDDSLLLIILTKLKEHSKSINTALNQKLVDNVLILVKEQLSKKFAKSNFESKDSDSLHKVLVEIIDKNIKSVKSQHNIIYLTLLGVDLNYSRNIILSSGYMSTYSPLEIASSTGNTGVMRFLIAFGADVNTDVNNYYKDKPLLIRAVINKSSIESLKFLIKFGADINLCDSSGKTILMYAAEEGHKDMINYLIDERKVDINAIDNNGNNALHHCLKGCKDIEIVKLLKGKGINTNHINAQNYTALDLARFLMAANDGFSDLVNEELANCIKLAQLLTDYASSNSLNPVINNNDNVAQQYVNNTSRVNREEGRGI